jgi:AraC-like DNA-binding protein
MIHRYIKPSPHLALYIKEYLLLHLKFDSHFVPPRKPYPVCPEHAIVFYIRGGVVQHHLSGEIRPLPRTSILGQCVNRNDKQISNEILMIHVRLQPGALFKLLRIPMTDLVEQTIDAEAVLGHEIHEVSEKMQNSASYEQMLQIVEAFFSKKIQAIKTEPRLIDSIGQVIMSHPHEFDLDRLAQQTYVSTRQFERIFMNQIGISPKFFARICRFYKAFEEKEANPTLDWRSIAWNTGYTDYQHLVKDFKQFAGVTPNLLLLENATSPERLIGVRGEV